MWSSRQNCWHSVLEMSAALVEARVLVPVTRAALLVPTAVPGEGRQIGLSSVMSTAALRVRTARSLS